MAYRGDPDLGITWSLKDEDRPYVLVNIENDSSGLCFEGIAEFDVNETLLINVGKAMALRAAMGMPIPEKYLNATY